MDATTTEARRPPTDTPPPGPSLRPVAVAILLLGLAAIVTAHFQNTLSPPLLAVSLLLMVVTLGAAWLIERQTKRLHRERGRADDEATLRAATQRRLIDNERHFRLLYERAPLPYQSLDADGNILEVNPAWLNSLGLQRDEAVGRWFGDILSPHGRDCFRTHFPRFQAAGEIHGVELEMTRKDGSVMTVAFDGQVGHDAEGRFERTHCIFADITERKRVERQLRFTQFAMDHMTDALYWINPDLSLGYVNQATCRGLGYSRAELMQMRVSDIDALMSETEVHTLVQRLGIDAEHALVFRSEHRRKDGSRFPVEIRAERFEHDGQTICLSVARNITEQLRRESALAESEQRFRMLFQSSLDGFLLTAPDGSILAANPAAQEMLGRDEKELMALGRSRVVDTADPRLKTALAERQANGRFQGELTLLRKDGSRFPGEISSVLFKLPDGRAVTSMVIRDISERRANERALQESEERLRLFITHAPAALAMFDTNMCYLAASKRWLKSLHLQEREILHRSHYELIPDLSEKYRDAHQRGLAGEVVRNDEDVVVQPDGTVQWWRWEEHPWYTADGEVGGILIFAEDISERKQALQALRQARDTLEATVASRTAELSAANERLRELDRLKSMFIASMSHELRTPLNSIIGFTGVLLQGMSGELSDQQRDQLQRVNNAGKHLLALITDVIDISKIEAGKIDAHAIEFELAPLLRETAASLRTEIEIKHLTFDIAVPDDLVMFTDRRRLLQCLLNLLSNAVKYTESGTIHVRVHADQQDVRITVGDTGIGISEADQAKLFRPFVRLDSHLKVKTGGTGLGLYLTKKIMEELLAGDIHLNSTPGLGTEVTLRLPLKLKTARRSA